MILALYGAGAMGREFKIVADATGQWPEVVFIDDHAAESSLLGCDVIGFQTFRRRFEPDLQPLRRNRHLQLQYCGSLRRNHRLHPRG